MASIGEDLRTYLINSTLLSGGPLPACAQEHVVEQNTIVANPPAKRIWLGRSGDTQPPDLSGEAGFRISEWDIEVFALNDTDVTAISEVLKTRLNGLQGAMGSRRVTAFVDDHDDEYLLRGIGNSTEAVNVAALRVTIFSS